MYKTSDTEKSENSSHDRYRTSEHNKTNGNEWMNELKQMHFFRLFCKM